MFCHPWESFGESFGESFVLVRAKSPSKPPRSRWRRHRFRVCVIGARWAAIWLLILGAGSAFPASSRADLGGMAESTSKYYRELRRRGLYRLAESYCLEQLSHTGVSPAERADLTLEFARTLAEHANLVGEPEQSELWIRSQKALTEFLNVEPDNPRRLLLEVQRALLPVNIGRARRRMAELQPYDAAARGRAIESLNTAIEGLHKTEALVAERLKKPFAARSVVAGEIRPWELKPLLGHVRFRRGEAILDLAHLHPAGSPERVARLVEAQKVFKSVAETPDDGELLWMSRVATVECSRRLGDPDRTLRDIEALEKLTPPPDMADRLILERSRVLMSQKNFREAAALLDQLENAQSVLGNSLGGELGFLQIRLRIAEWKAGQAGKGPAPAGQDAKMPEKVPAPLLQALEDRAARLNRDVGGYWSARADLLIRQLQDTQQYGPELAGLVSRAQTAFNAGKSDEAVQLYGEAAAKAHRDGRDELTFQFGFTRASIEIKSQSWVDAAADLLELAEQFPKNPKAAQAHLLAAFALGKSYDEKPSRTRREEYARVLEEHRKNFDGDETVPEAAWMRADLDERRGQYTKALELFKTIPKEHKRGAVAQVAVARIYERILDRLRELKQPVDDWQDDAVKTLRKMLPAVREGANRWDINQAEVAVRLARILLKKHPPQFDSADRLLVRAEQSLTARTSAPPDTPPASLAADAARNSELRATARQLQVVSLAGQERFQEARTRLQQLSGTDPAELLRILDGIAPLASDERRDPFHDLGALQLEAALQLNEHRAKLSVADQRRLDECLANAYFATGEIRKGRKIFETLVRQNPRDTSVLTSYAEMLVKCGSQECLTEAVEAWRKLDSLHQPGSQEWYPVRYELCRTLLMSKQSAEAAKLLKVTRLVYPKPESEAWQKKFADLEAQCEVDKPKAKR